MKREAAPDVTIVTPSYNQAGFIEATIRSVLSQQGVLIEYLIMDGGSTDGTVSILENYRGQLEYESEKDRGQADAINKGFRRARGRVLAYLNSDDTYLPGAVGRALGFLDSHPEYALVYGEGYHVDAAGRILDRYYTEPFDFERLAEICFICQPTVFFRRELLASIGYLDAGLQYCMDYDYWIRASKRYSIGYIPAYLAASTLHPETKTLSRKYAIHREILATVQRHYGRVPVRWIAAYAHASLERYLTRKGKYRDALFRILVYSLFAFKYISVNHSLPLTDFLSRLNGTAPDEKDVQGSRF